MPFTFEEALKFPFTDPKWSRKLGIPIVLMLIFSAIAMVGSLGTSFFSMFLEEAQMNNGAVGAFLILMVPFMGLGLVSILAVPVQIYLQGYYVGIQKNILHNNQPYLPESEPLREKFIWFLHFFLVVLGPVLVVLFIAAIFGGVFLFAAAAETLIFSTPLFTILGGFAISLVAVVVGAFIVFFLVPAMVYQYLLNGRVGDAYNVSAVSQTINAHWKSLLKASLLSIVVAILGGFVSFIFCFASFLVEPAITVYTSVVSAYIFGNYYRVMKESSVSA